MAPNATKRTAKRRIRFRLMIYLPKDLPLVSDDLWEKDEHKHHKRREPQKKSADPAGVAIALLRSPGLAKAKGNQQHRQNKQVRSQLCDEGRGARCSGSEEKRQHRQAAARRCDHAGECSKTGNRGAPRSGFTCRLVFFYLSHASCCWSRSVDEASWTADNSPHA